ncbi:MFS transporter [Paenibacillus rigui]|uniref:MFS transporter n=1 Tax=Paenibacillus rigui TaxID=554312 RepID=A0A229UYC2_9BACL|nr:MFS transporter [Paenibacillus rigui]OXM88241.1 MFS transporter [Paenibacillus rigui]
MESGKTGALLSLSSVPFIMTLGNSMLIPTLPTLTRQLHVSSFQISLIITVYSMVAIVLIPVAGYLSDRFGRKMVMIPSLVIAGVGGAVCAVAASFMEQSYLYILGGRLLQGIGAAGAAPIVLPLVGDLFQKESDVSAGLGLIETANTFGKVLSPILGSLLAAVVWYLPFYAIPVLCLVSLLLVGLLVRIPKDRADQKSQKPYSSFRSFWQAIVDLFRDKARWLIAVFFTGAVCMYAVFAALFYLSNLLEDTYGIDGVSKGWLLAIPLAALCLVSFITGKLIGENKPLMKWLTFIGLAITCGALICCGLFGEASLGRLLWLLGAMGAGIGAALPSLDALIIEGIEKEQRGTVTSLYSSMRFIGVAAGPPVASLFMNASVNWLFYSTSILGGIAALWTLMAIRPAQSLKQKAASR